MVSITFPRKNGADIVTPLEMVRKPKAAEVDKGKDRKTEVVTQQNPINVL